MDQRITTTLKQLQLQHNFEMDFETRDAIAETMHEYRERMGVPMICKPCGVAGDLNALTQDGVYVEMMYAVDRNFYNDASRLAMEMHESCRGRTHCDCQHIVEKVTREGNTV